MKKMLELKKVHPSWSDYQTKLRAQVLVNEVMAKVEVITLGGAASQDNFPNVKLVQVMNPYDYVPTIMDLTTMKPCYKGK